MTPPKPILQLVDGFATDDQSGGAALFGIQLARHLSRRRFSSLICGLWRYGHASETRWIEQLTSEGIKTIFLIEQPTNLKYDLLRAGGLLYDLITTTRPAIINTHFERGDLLALLMKIVHPHSPLLVRTMHTEQQWQKRPWLGKAMNVIYPLAWNAEVAISVAAEQIMNKRFTAYWNRRQVERIYNGISTNLIHTLTTQSHAGRSHDQLRFAIVGRLEQQKGHVYFLQAAARVLDLHPHTEFWVIGMGSELNDLRQQVEHLGISAAVTFWGARHDVPALLAQVHCLVSASLWEGFPTVILEAMMANVPVIATDVSGSRELVRPSATGILVPKCDAASLAAAMVWAIEHSEALAQLAVAAATNVRQYTMENTAAHYDHLYERLLEPMLRAV